MKKNIYILAIVFSICAIVFIAREYAVANGEPVVEKTKTFKFTHQKHLAAGVECVQCHNKVDSSSLASDKNLPTHEECKSCHESEVNEKCSFCHTDESNPQALPNPVRDIFFNHKIHVADSTLKCETCHQGLDKVDFASSVNLPSMTTCVK